MNARTPNAATNSIVETSWPVHTHSVYEVSIQRIPLKRNAGRNQAVLGSAQVTDAPTNYSFSEGVWRNRWDNSDEDISFPAEPFIARLEAMPCAGAGDRLRGKALTDWAQTQANLGGLSHALLFQRNPFLIPQDPLRRRRGNGKSLPPDLVFLDPSSVRQDALSGQDFVPLLHWRQQDGTWQIAYQWTRRPFGPLARILRVRPIF